MGTDFDSSSCVANIRKILTQKGMAVGQLEKAACISQGYLSRLMGSRAGTRISADILTRLATALNVRVEDIVGYQVMKPHVPMSPSELRVYRFLERVIDDTVVSRLIWSEVLSKWFAKDADTYDMALEEKILLHPQNGLIERVINYDSIFLDKYPMCEIMAEGIYKAKFADMGYLAVSCVEVKAAKGVVYGYELKFIKQNPGDSDYDCETVCSADGMDSPFWMQLKCLHENVKKILTPAAAETKEGDFIDQYMNDGGTDYWHDFGEYVCSVPDFVHRFGSTPDVDNISGAYRLPGPNGNYTITLERRDFVENTAVVKVDLTDSPDAAVDFERLLTLQDKLATDDKTTVTVLQDKERRKYSFELICTAEDGDDSSQSVIFDWYADNAVKVYDFLGKYGNKAVSANVGSNIVCKEMLSAMDIITLYNVFWRNFWTYANNKNGEFTSVFGVKMASDRYKEGFYALPSISGDHALYLLVQKKNKSNGASVQVAFSKNDSGRKEYCQYTSYKDELTELFGENVIWADKGPVSYTTITYRRSFDILDDSGWKEIFDWYMDVALKMRQFLSDHR